MTMPGSAASGQDRKSGRMSAAERRDLILEAARAVFSRHGYEAARTQDIARGAGISEALMYRHFRSKKALHTAVLRQIIAEQNSNYAQIGLHDLTPGGLVRNIHGYFTIATGHGPDRIREGFHLLLSSVVGAVIGSVWLATQGRDRATPIPFGPYLAIAGWIVFFWGPQIIDAYLRFAGLK